MLAIMAQERPAWIERRASLRIIHRRTGRTDVLRTAEASVASGLFKSEALDERWREEQSLGSFVDANVDEMSLFYP